MYSLLVFEENFDEFGEDSVALRRRHCHPERFLKKYFDLVYNDSLLCTKLP